MLLLNLNGQEMSIVEEGLGFSEPSLPSLLALRRYTLVHALTQPDVRLHVPRVQQDLEVGCKFDVQDVDIRSIIP